VAKSRTSWSVRIKEAFFVEEGYGFVAIQYTVIAIVALKRH